MAEFLPAVLTTVWLLSGVDSHMRGQLMALGELLTTFLALIGFFTCVYSFMVGFLLISHELLFTKGTRITSVISMSSFVYISDALASKGFATNRTQEWPEITVGMTTETICKE